MKMKKTRQLLLLLFWGVLVLAVGLVVIFETDTLPCGIMADSKQTEFLLTALMELLTLADIYLALRLFKFDKVHHDLTTRQVPALRQWGVIRLLLLLVPMLVNTLLYYIYMNTTFGYMAIILALCLPFVYPSEGRCRSEIGL